MIDSLYDIWYQAKCDVYKTYTDTKPEKRPRSQEKEFKPVRNALIYEACKLSPALKLHSKTKSGTINKLTVMNAALRFGRSIARTFETNFRRYDPADDEDIDRQLRREIWAVKNGENLLFL